MNIKTILLLISIILVTLVSCNSNEQSVQSNISYRGVVLYPNDIVSIGSSRLVQIMSDANLNLLGIHAQHQVENLAALREFIESDQGKVLLEECKNNNISVEYEVHALEELLPRDLFTEHPDYFRVDNEGIRVNDFNMCFSSQGAYNEIEKNLLEITKWLKPTTNRYFFWTDDVKDAFCNCELCSEYTESEQALMYENKLLEMLQKVNTEATVAHLAYHNTLKAPRSVTPSNGIFLEYAPISRNYSEPLTSEHKNYLMENLEVFPIETAHLLEYWLDVSMFSGWEKDNWTEVPWNEDYFKRDIDYYKSLGFTSVTSFATWMIHQQYFDLYGEDESIAILNTYGNLLK